MSDHSTTQAPTCSPWSHRVAWVLACGVFPLIWMGGLVTTYDAGMAVPDWPNTYGYNLFLYPLSSFLAVWSLFLEHTHRLIAASMGMLTIVLAVLLWRTDSRRWVRMLGIAVVVGALFQGTLGGLRVLGDSLTLADIHGCTAPLFFALCVALVVVTEPTWREKEIADWGEEGIGDWGLGEEEGIRDWGLGIGKKEGGEEENGANESARLADPPASSQQSSSSFQSPIPNPQSLGFAVLVGIYIQIVLGAQLRHLPADSGLWWFAIWVWLHLATAGVLLVAIVWLVFAIRKNVRHLGNRSWLMRRAWMLLVLFGLQLVLAAATWVTNYGWPAWFSDNFWRPEFIIVAKGRWQVLTTTAHVAVGSLILVTALSLVFGMWRGFSAFAKRATSETGHKCHG